VYLYYTESSTGSDTSGTPDPLGNRVYRYTWDGSALVAGTLVLDLPVTPGPNHDGGIIAFGPDGKLYVVIGDLNRQGQLQNVPTGAPPDDTSVILRVNDDGTVPADNPFAAQGGNLAKYYAYGIRNAFGMAFDPVTDKLWITENGPDTFDEINLAEPGFNSGWRQIMGPDARDPQGAGDLFQVPGSHYGDPKFSWLDTVGPTAIVFLNSARLGSQYQHDAFVGDINHGRLYRFRPNAARDGFEFESPGLADLVADTDAELEEVTFGTGFGGITDLKVGPDGFLYVLSFGDGKIFRVASSEAVPVIDVSPMIVDFGAVPAGSTSAARYVTIANQGNADLEVTGITTSFPADPPQCESFALTHPAVPFTIAPGASTAIEVTFTPAGSQMFDCLLTTASNDPARPSVEVTLWGTGITAEPVKVALVSHRRLVTPGAMVPYTVRFRNATKEPQGFAYLLILNLPNGMEVPVRPPAPMALPAHRVVRVRGVLPIAEDAMPGTCTLKVVLLRPSGGTVEVIGLSAVDIRVVPRGAPRAPP
jgi:glucose/arabinose dehydrogenase